ncbi:MAG TPA: Slp family lipoprotein [Geobacteraceae bacterium]|nr:Slp family lipoprotein [Geobacteraceae bacterium]
MRTSAFLALMLLFLTGCAPIFSDQSLRLVDRGMSFSELRKKPDQCMDRYLLLGGAVAAVENTNEGGELEVVQFGTDEDGRIIDTSNSGGRFLARSPDLLDPAVYQPGFLVVLVGKCAGSKTMRLGDMDYTYPVLDIKEVHIQEPEVTAPPVFHFGVGVGTIIH